MSDIFLHPRDPSDENIFGRFEMHFNPDFGSAVAEGGIK